MLYRLIYASEVAAPMDPASIDALLADARQRNDRRDLTGMLAFDSRCFLQVLEGSRDTLSNLYGALVRDPRHRALVLIEHAPITERLFADWTMGFAAASADLRRLYLQRGSSGRFEPASLTADAALGLLRELARRQG